MADVLEDDLKSAMREHVLVPAQEMAKLGKSSQPVLTHAEGIYVYAEDGSRLIDGPAGMWCAQVGYGRKEIVDAIAHQAMTLPYASPWYMATSPAVRLAEKIATLTPGDLNRIFFTTGGSTAVDSAWTRARRVNAEVVKSPVGLDRPGVLSGCQPSVTRRPRWAPRRPLSGGRTCSRGRGW